MSQWLAIKSMSKARPKLFRLQRRHKGPPGFDYVYQQARADPETVPAMFQGGIYWLIAGTIAFVWTRQREDDAFNSPLLPGQAGYYESKTRTMFLTEKPESTQLEDISSDYTKWRYRSALRRKVKPVIRVFLKNIKYFEDWKKDLNVVVLGSGYCFDLDFKFLADYVGEGGRVYLVDKNTDTSRQALVEEFGESIPPQFVLLETDISKTILDENEIDLDAELAKLTPGEIWRPAFPGPFEGKADIVISALVISQMRMLKSEEGREIQVTEAHLRLLDRLRNEGGHILIHDDCIVNQLFPTRDRILNGLEKMNLDAHLKYDWPPDNICQFPSINDHILQTYMVHVRGRQCAI